VLGGRILPNQWLGIKGISMATHLAKPVVFASGTLFGDDQAPKSGDDPIFENVPFSKATALDTDIRTHPNGVNEAKCYLQARTNGKIHPDTKIYGRVIPTYLAVPDPTSDAPDATKRCYPALEVFINGIMEQMALAFEVGIRDGIVIDELLVPADAACPLNYGTLMGAKKIPQRIRETMNLDQRFKNMDLCVWFLRPDSVHLAESHPEGNAFLHGLFHHCDFVLAEMHQLEPDGPSDLLSSGDYLRTVVNSWVGRGVPASQVKAKAVISIPDPYFQLSLLAPGEFDSIDERKSYIINLIRYYGALIPDDNSPSIRELSAGIAPYFYSEEQDSSKNFKSAHISDINAAIDEYLS
jgi:hypothetical protein